MTIAAKLGAMFLTPFIALGGGNHANAPQIAQADQRPSVQTGSSTNNGWHLGQWKNAFMQRTNQNWYKPTSTTTPALSITNITGPTALKIDESGTWTVNAREMGTSSLRYSVTWGDEGSTMHALSANTATQATTTFTHSYATAGTYTPTFTVTDTLGHTITKASAPVVVGAATAAHISAISPASGVAGSSVTLTGTGFTASSTIRFGDNTIGSTTLNSNGTLTFSTANNTPIGGYKVRVDNGSGTLSNAVSYYVTAPVTAKLSVNGIDAPTTLSVDATGTWTVHAATNTSGNLHYSVVWGDENTMLRALSAVLPNTTQTSATFTHAYSNTGTYTPTFTITDDAGHKVSTSASVVVTTP